MTIGTAMLGVAATGVLGWAAAATHDGTTPSATGGAVTSNANAGTTPTANANGTTTTTTTLTNATGLGLTTVRSGSSHVSTGGS